MMLKLNVLLCTLGLAVAMTASCGSIVILDGVEDQGEGGSSTGYGASVGSYTSGSGIGGFGSTVSSTAMSSTSTGIGPSATCASYCKDIQANCTGPTRQYADETTCLNACFVLPPGTISDMQGNSVGCRAYHAAAPSKADPKVHCSHAGITGGDKDPSTTMDMAPCGPGCDAFCALALKYCPTIWPNQASCKADCSKFKPSVQPFSTSEVAGDTFNCRAYHLTVATLTPATHCEHIKLDSVTCK